LRLETEKGRDWGWLPEKKSAFSATSILRGAKRLNKKKFVAIKNKAPEKKEWG